MTRPVSGSARRDAGPASVAPAGAGVASTGDRLPPRRPRTRPPGRVARAATGVATRVGPSGARLALLAAGETVIGGQVARRRRSIGGLGGHGERT